MVVGTKCLSEEVSVQIRQRDRAIIGMRFCVIKREAVGERRRVGNEKVCFAIRYLVGWQDKFLPHPPIFARQIREAVLR